MPAPTSNVLIVSDDPIVRESISSALAETDLSPTLAGGTEEAKRKLSSETWAVLVVCASRGKISGLDLLNYARSHASGCEVIFIGGGSGSGYMTEALRLGAFECFGKFFDPHALARTVQAALGAQSPFRYLSQTSVRSMLLELDTQDVSVEAVRALACAVEARDVYTRRHGEHVSHYAVQIAQRAGVGTDDLRTIQLAALLHDVGSIAVPDAVLTKAGALSEAELQQVRCHPVVGAEILANMKAFTPQVPLVRHHHENWNGTGYPDGLQAEEIPFGARVLRLADSIDAMLMPRSYRDAQSPEEVLDELTRGAGEQFDPRLTVEAVAFCQSTPNGLILPVAAT